MKKNNLLTYLLINVVVSAITVIVILFVWDRLQPDLPVSAPTNAAFATALQTPTAEPAALPPTDQPVIEIQTIFGAGAADQEYALVHHIGEGDLNLAGWKLNDEDGNTYEFPDLTLYAGGSVQVFTRSGANTVTELFWQRAEAAWKSGEKASLFDPAGNLRAAYQIP